MGNFFGKSDSLSREANLKVSPPLQKPFNKYASVIRHNFHEVSVSDSVGKPQSSFGSFSSKKSNASFSGSSVSRPWSRISRRKWNEKTLLDPLSCSKTAWPVPYFESLFLPEFKIRDEITEDSFKVVGVISSGAFGKVFKVLKQDSNDMYAMKVLSKAQLVASNSINQVKEEVKIQRLVGHHPFIVNCPFYWQSRKQLYIISEYISEGELLKLLQEKGPLPVDIVKLYTAQLAVTLDFLHNAGIVYRDLKLENILLNSRGHIQLIDFGLSKWLKFGMRTNTICGTLQYIAPEVLQQKPYGHAVDWWSLGILVVWLVNGECPYGCCIDEQGDVRETPKVNGGKEVRDLVERLLVADPVRRLRSLSALKRTALFMGFDFEKTEEFSVDLEKLTGTIGLVHMSCLEKWLSMSNTHSCELCGYNFQTLRTPKYRVLYSIYYWVFFDRNPQYHRGLKSDFIVFVVLTPIAFIGVYSCIVAADFYSKEPNKYSPASRWTTISLLIMVVLLTFAYYLWVAVTIRFHMRIWYIWWQANNIVKVMPRDPNSGSMERVTLSVQSSHSRQSSRRAANGSSSNIGSSPEAQVVADEVTV